MNAAVVTVIVPCRDRGRWIEDSADSVFAQTHPAVEMVVVDDGSTDAFTRRVLDGFDWPRTSVVRQDRRHAAAARNLALTRAGGGLVCCLEAGDRLAPTYLEAAVARLAQVPSAAFVTAGWRTTIAPEIEVRPRDGGVVSLLAALPSAAGVTRVEAVRAAGGYDESLADGGADLDLWLRCLAGGGSGVLLDDELVRPRGEPRLDPAFVRRHAALYERHAADVVLRRETVLAALADADRATRTEGLSLDERRTLEQAQRRIEVLEAAVADAQFQVAHVRASLSWRLTEPVRAVLRLLTRLRPAASEPARRVPSGPAR